MVAMELAASCRPFRKSKARATTTSTISKRPGPWNAILEVLDQDGADAVGHVLEAVDDLFQMIVDLRAHDVGHGVLAGRAAVEGLDAGVVEGVGLVLQPGDLLGDLV